MRKPAIKEMPTHEVKIKAAVNPNFDFTKVLSVDSFKLWIICSACCRFVSVKYCQMGSSVLWIFHHHPDRCHEYGSLAAFPVVRERISG